MGGGGGWGGLLENGWRGRWDRRFRIASWCCGVGHLGRYSSRKVITGVGKVWDFGVSIRSVYMVLDPA